MDTTCVFDEFAFECMVESLSGALPGSGETADEFLIRSEVRLGPEQVSVTAPEEVWTEIQAELEGLLAAHDGDPADAQHQAGLTRALGVLREGRRGDAESSPEGSAGEGCVRSWAPGQHYSVVVTDPDGEIAFTGQILGEGDAFAVIGDRARIVATAARRNDA